MILEYYDRNEYGDIYYQWCPPGLVMSSRENKIIKWAWHLFKGKNAYIVDPMSESQVNYAIYHEIPLWFRIPLRMICFIPIKKKYLHI